MELSLPVGLASSRERASSIPPLPSLSFPLSFLRLTANFSSLFRSDGTQESTLRRRRRQTNFRRWLSGTAGRSTDTSLAQNGNNSHRRRRQCFQDERTDGRTDGLTSLPSLLCVKIIFYAARTPRILSRPLQLSFSVLALFG